jgi:hypothetical protein
MTDDDRGHGPDDLGDDEQEFEVEEYERYIEDPPADLEVAEDDDNDAEAAYDWADRHPAAARHDETTLVNNQSDEAAEEAAVQERRPPR